MSWLRLGSRPLNRQRLLHRPGCQRHAWSGAGIQCTAPAAPPSWVYNYKSDRFAMIMNAVPDTASAIAAAVAAMEGSLRPTPLDYGYS
jgi:hypothetical protein